MKLKKSFFIPSILLFLIAIALVGGFLWWNENSKAISNDSTEVDFLVVKGRSATQIAQELYKKELIRNPIAFKIYVQVRGLSDEIQAGRYSLSPSLSLSQVIEVLVKGPKDVWVTIPEGLRREEMLDRFVNGLSKGGIEADQFRQEFLSLTQDLEGYLFPDTYLFPKEASASTVVSTLRNTFNKRLKDLEDELKSSNLSLREIVILASIIERETKTNAERPVVAGILLNRLKIGMGLQADATLQYAVANVKCQMPNPPAGKVSVKCDDWWPILTKEDLQIISPYNTYKYRGLPPTPIANPGLSSLKAAILPEDTPYLYYIHDPEGNIHYAQTLQEHNENVRKYLGR